MELLRIWIFRLLQFRTVFNIIIDLPWTPFTRCIFWHILFLISFILTMAIRYVWRYRVILEVFWLVFVSSSCGRLMEWIGFARKTFKVRVKCEVINLGGIRDFNTFIIYRGDCLLFVDNNVWFGVFRCVIIIILSCFRHFFDFI